MFAPSAGSSKASRIVIRHVLSKFQRYHCQVICRASKSSSAFAGWPVPESVRDNVKTSFLNDAVRSDSRLWRKDNDGDYELNGGNHVNAAISNYNDPLDDLHLERSTRYFPHLPRGVIASHSADPFQLTKVEIDSLSQSIRNDLLGTDHPVLNQAASYFFNGNADGGKKVRPLMVLLLSRALAETETAHAVDPTFLLTPPESYQRHDLPVAQRRLAEISEMIHTASLFHDDVIDEATQRRGAPAVHVMFGNKMAILAGDYLLARASIFLARLRDLEVMETMSTVIEHLVRGEIMQLRGSSASERASERLVYYLRKTFYKTGSLMANSCKSAALLGDYHQDLVRASYMYGKHVGMAFQLVDDVLDYEGSLTSLGKPALSDIRAGIVTAPILFAAEEFPELEPLLDRKFQHDGDVDRAVELIFQSDGMQRTKELARAHAERAMDAILTLEPSAHRDALVHLAYKVVARTK